jgi:hypothetical protein
VTSGGLEKELRDCLNLQASRAPGAPDVADTVVRRANRVRRRRTVAGTLAVVLTTAVGAYGVVRMGDVPRPAASNREDFAGQVGGRTSVARAAPPVTETAAPVTLTSAVEQEPMAAGSALPVDVVVAGMLHTFDGRLIDLARLGTVTETYRVPDGWFVIASRDTTRLSLWFVAAGATPSEVLAGVDGLAVAPDGRRVAWRTDNRVFAGTVTREGVTGRRDTTVPVQSTPVGFVGRGVLIASGTRRYDVWWPDLGPYTQQSKTVPTGVYGALPDGRTLVAQIPGRSAAQPCLALLDAAAGLVVRKQACDVPLTSGSVGWLSPDGRWLVAEGAVDTSVLVDLAHAFGDRKPTLDAGPGPYGAAAWLDKVTLVHAGPGQQLVYVRVDRLAAGQAGGVEMVQVDKGKGQVQIVPRLGV